MRLMYHSRRKETYIGEKRFDNKLYTDGSWNYRTKAGGWCVSLQHKVLKSGNETETTNIRMEITAIIKALEFARPSTIILTDSQFTIDSINVYIPAWDRGGWTKDMANKALMQKLWRAWQNRAEDVHLKWVRGHAGLAGNEIADAEAVRQRKMLEGTVVYETHEKKRKPKPIKLKKKQLARRPKGIARARQELEDAHNLRFGKNNW